MFKLIFSIVCILGLFYIGLILVGNIFFDASMRFFDAKFTYSASFFRFETFFSLACILFIVFSKSISFKINSKQLLFLSNVLIVIISLFFIFTFDAIVSVDAKDIVDVANDWYINNNLSTEYLEIYPYQFGIIQLLYLLFKVFHYEESVILCVRLINIFCLIVINTTLFNILKRFFSTNIQCIYLVLFPFCLVFCGLASYVYGDIIGFTFAFVSLYFCLENTKQFKVTNLLMQLLFILLGIYFRLPSSIIAVAEIIIVLISSLRIREKAILILTTMVVLVLGLKIGALVCLFVYNFQTYDLPFVSRLAMGFDVSYGGPREPGWYSGYTVNLYNIYNKDSAAISLQSKQDLLYDFTYLLSNPRFAINFISRKFYSMWLLPDFEIYSVLRAEELLTYPLFGSSIAVSGSVLMYFLNLVFSISFLVIEFFAFFGVINTYKNKNLSMFSFVLIFVGGLSYHMLFEAKARYVIPFAMCLLPLMCDGIRYLRDYMLQKTVTNKIRCSKLVTVITSAFLIVLFLFQFNKQDLPIVYYEAYTDTQTNVILTPGKYYQIPVSIDENIHLNRVCLYMYHNDNIDENTFIQLDILDENGINISSSVINANELDMYDWPSFKFDNVNLTNGNYLFQVSANNVAELDFGIICGEQYSYINQDYISLNGYSTNLRANIKLYREL